MRNLFFWLWPILLLAALFQACDDGKTYAELLDDEETAINDYIAEMGIDVISVSDFEKDTITICNDQRNEYVGFKNGIYMQIVDRYGTPRGSDLKYSSFEDARKFESGNLILVRFLEVDLMRGDTTIVSNVLNKMEFLNTYPDGFRYTDTGTTVYGQFVKEAGLSSYYYGDNTMMGIYGTKVPEAWLMALKYVRDGAHVRLIVPSKRGHSTAMKHVFPYFYDLRSLTIY